MRRDRPTAAHYRLVMLNFFAAFWLGASAAINVADGDRVAAVVCVLLTIAPFWSFCRWLESFAELKYAQGHLDGTLDAKARREEAYVPPDGW